MKSHELILDVNFSKGPDPERKLDRFKHWKFKYFGTPIAPNAWPTGKPPIIYFYFWMDPKSVARPPVFGPDDLLYLGERAAVKCFKHGWEPGHKVKRYHWLPRAQSRRIFAVMYELPRASNYARQDKRRSLEYCIVRELVDRYGERYKKFLLFTGRFDFRVAWLRATDVKRHAQLILEDLKSSYGV